MTDTPEKSIVLDEIPVSLDPERVLERLKLRNHSQRLRQTIQELIEMATPVARPKAMYKISHVSMIDRKRIDIDGIEFTSYVPTLNFSQNERVFTYLATCGTEVNALEVPTSDFMKHFTLNILKELVLRQASEYLTNYLKKSYHLKELSRIGPGEALGPLVQQRKLLAVLGDVEAAVGVRLSAHNLMVPEKSSSGVLFETDVKLESCQLCPDAKCQGRRAAYQPELVRQHHAPAV